MDKIHILQRVIEIWQNELEGKVLSIERSGNDFIRVPMNLGPQHNRVVFLNHYQYYVHKESLEEALENYHLLTPFDENYLVPADFRFPKDPDYVEVKGRYLLPLAFDRYPPTYHDKFRWGQPYAPLGMLTYVDDHVNIYVQDDSNIWEWVTTISET